MSESNIVEGSAVCMSPGFWKRLSTRGRYSVERLTHFNCGNCEKWFSIGDPPSDRLRWSCPWCGLDQDFDPILPEDIVNIKTDKVDA